MAPPFVPPTRSPGAAWPPRAAARSRQETAEQLARHQRAQRWAVVIFGVSVLVSGVFVAGLIKGAAAILTLLGLLP